MSIFTVSDGEFCSLRAQGEKRELHVWQLIHDAKESVKKKRKTALLKMLTLTHSLMLMTNKEERFPCSGGADGISQTVSIHPSLLFLAMSLFSCIT